MWRIRTVSARMLAAVLVVLIATVTIGGVLDVQLTRRSFDQQYQDRARSVANVVAAIPAVRTAVAAGDPNHTIAPLANRIASGADASYVVVTGLSGIRFSHPNPYYIGKKLEEPLAVLDGRDHVGIDKGSLGRSANGKAPIFDAAHRVIGQVSVGIVESRVAEAVRTQITAIALYALIALAVGVIVAFVLTRALRRATFGLEVSEIAALLQDREAMLHGIREGVIGFDARGRITLINDEARRLVGASGGVVGRPLDDVVPPGRLRDVLAGRGSGKDDGVLTDDALLIVNRNRVVVAGREVGSVATLRDQTELESLVRELHSTSGLASALRAQEHEFANRLHVIAGLIDLGDFDEASRFATTLTRTDLESAEQLRARISPAPVAALLLAKISIAHEREIDLVVTAGSHLDAPDEQAHALMTVIGNLVDNALDAVADQPAPRRVTVDLSDAAGSIAIAVRDNGPGVPADAIEEIFVDGFSTKSPRGTARRGLGLALVQRLVHRAGGTITVSSTGGACFEIRLPMLAVATRSGAPTVPDAT